MRRSVLLAAFLAALGPARAVAQLVMSPEELVFRDFTRPQAFTLSHDGAAVTPAEIMRIRAGVRKTGDALPAHAVDTHFSDYSYMFHYRLGEDGRITLTPNERFLEIGHYTLVVHTVHGTVSGFITAQLEHATPPPPSYVVTTRTTSWDIELPAYPRGQEVVLDLGPDPGNTYFWYLDGALHASGPGLTTFRATPGPGRHALSFVAQDPAGVIVATWSGQLVVEP